MNTPLLVPHDLKTPSKTKAMIILVLYFISFIAMSCESRTSSNVGICYGRLGNDLPSLSRSIKLIKSLNASNIKIYDANLDILHLLSGTKLRVSIMLPNQDISKIASNQTLADEWVERHVLPFYPRTRIQSILVGNEILTDSTEIGKRLWPDLVPAMQRITTSLRTHRGHNHNTRYIQVGTPLAMDMLTSSFPPSSGAFRPDIRYSVMEPLLNFLNRTRSPFFLDVYTYFPWSSDPENINLEYALLLQNKNFTYTDPATGLTYTNLLDQMLDSVYFAMADLGYHDIKLTVAETGWPNDGRDVYGANIYNAETYNHNVIKKMTAEPPIGTPARPGEAIETYLFSLYDEDLKTGPEVERHWGLMSSKGDRHYFVDLTGGRYWPDIP